MHSFIALLLSLHILLYSALSCIPFSFTQYLSTPPITATQENTNVPPNDTAESTGVQITAPSAVLMEASTGTIIYEKDSHAVRHPASITKIMTLNLIFEAIENGKISMTDTVTVSEHAAGMGGSQVFLEAGETQTVETMIKCISIASANDASVAMAEFVSGSEAAFVAEMNEKAKELGMKDTTFVNCCGLDTEGHMTSAYDIALMSRELSVNHPQIHDYCTIWMDTITHNTAKGSSEFGLTNTNKLIRQYPYATGLKTGSTGLAKFCLSATAKKDGMEMIAVVLGAENPNNRFNDAATLLNHGFAKCKVYTDENKDALPNIQVKKGKTDTVSLSYKNTFQYLSVDGADLSQIKKELHIPKSVDAPLKKGEKVGEATYSLNDKKIGTVDIILASDISKAKFMDYLQEILQSYF